MDLHGILTSQNQLGTKWNWIKATTLNIFDDCSNSPKALYVKWEWVNNVIILTKFQQPSMLVMSLGCVW